MGDWRDRFPIRTSGSRVDVRSLQMRQCLGCRRPILQNDGQFPTSERRRANPHSHAFCEATNASLRKPWIWMPGLVRPGWEGRIISTHRQIPPDVSPRFGDPFTRTPRLLILARKPRTGSCSAVIELGLALPSLRTFPFSYVPPPTTTHSPAAEQMNPGILSCVWCWNCLIQVHPNRITPLHRKLNLPDCSRFPMLRITGFVAPS